MGKQEATDDVGMPFAIESNIMESYVSDDEHGEIVFPRINADVSIEDKINLIVERHNNDYYRGIPVDQLEHVNQQIRPRKLVTSEYLHKIRSEICRNAKLSWIMSKKEEIYAAEFMQTLTNNKFTSVKKAQEAALALFKVHNREHYHANRVTITSELQNGKRRKAHMSCRNKSQTEEKYTKKQFIDMLKEVLQKEETIQVIEAHVQKKSIDHFVKINSNSENIRFAKEVCLLNKTLVAKRQTVTTIALFLDLIDQIN